MIGQKGGQNVNQMDGWERPLMGLSTETPVHPIRLSFVRYGPGQARAGLSPPDLTPPADAGERERMGVRNRRNNNEEEIQT